MKSKRKVCFVVNSVPGWNEFRYLPECLPGASLTITEEFPSNCSDYTLVILWNYRKIINGLGNENNVVVFHSSDLPKGRGWAPIYYTVANLETHYCITGFKPVDEVDAGEVLVKAKFSMRPEYTATKLRQWDTEITFKLIQKILDKMSSEGILGGLPQQGLTTHYARRRPADNEIKIDCKISDVWNHVRGCEDAHPAYFFHEGNKFLVYIEPEIEPHFPNDLKIVFFTEL